jgi:hypothetical protein
MANEWYIQLVGKEFGPLSDDDLRALVAQQQLTPSGKVRKSSSATWVLASRVRGLFPQDYAITGIVSEASAPKTGTIVDTRLSDPVPQFREQFHPVELNLVACPSCGKRISPNASSCPQCGHSYFQPNRSVAIALAWTLGGLGIHKFYLRKPGDGVASLLFCWTFIPALLALVDGFQYLSMDDAAFSLKFGSSQTSVVHRSRAGRTHKAAIVQGDNSYVNWPIFQISAIDIIRWVIVGVILLVSAICIMGEPPAWPAAIVMCAIGISLLPVTQKWFDSFAFAQKRKLRLETIVLWTLGVLCLGNAVWWAVHLRSAIAVLAMVLIAFCLIPPSWERIAAHSYVIRKYGVAIRWSVAILALLMLPKNGLQLDRVPGAHGDEWYDVGNLIDRSALDWQGATKENKLATCGELMAILLAEDALTPAVKNSIHDTEDFSAYAETLVGFVNSATVKSANDAENWSKYVNQTVREIAMKGALAKGYIIANKPLNGTSQPAIERASASRQVIGSWWDARPFVKNKTTYFRQNGKVFMENKFDDGSARVIEMLEKGTSSGPRFTYKPDNGDYFLINAEGNLEWWDEDGHYFTSPKAN